MALLQFSPSTLCCSLLPGKPPVTHPVNLVKFPSLPLSILPENSRYISQSTNYNLSAACQHPSATRRMQENPHGFRRETDFQPVVWDDHFVESSSESKESNERRIRDLREEVRNVLIHTAEPMQKMILVDAIDNLGVAYHFDEEIQAILQHIYNHDENIFGDNLHAVALRFKLLRQQGYRVSSDVFEKFKDKEGKFNQSLTSDARGLLSLYEASHHRLPNEDILDEALTFTTQQLKSICPQLNPALGRHVQRSLLLPLQRAIPKLQARTYITFYEEDESRNNVLLELAKLDFNHIQALHQAEIKELMRWWKELELIKTLPYARDRTVESFMWGMEENYLPQFSQGRIAVVKHICLGTQLDDIYDSYGTMEEIELFSDSIDRWDLIKAMDQLPEYMKPCYLALYNLVHEIEYISNENSDIGINYLKKTWESFTKEMLQDAKWSRAGYIPSVEEYLSVKHVTAFGFIVIIVTALSMGNMVTKEGFDYIIGEPKILRIPNEITRLLNDLGTSEIEEGIGTINSVRCYMKEHDVSKEDAQLGIKSLIVEKWKELNQEALKHIPLPKELIKASFNYARLSETFYLDGQDGYRDSDNWMKEHINTLLVTPIHI